MKILLTSDWHLDAITAGVARLDEIDPYLDALLETVERERIDFVFFLGDMNDPGGMRASLYAEKSIQAAGRIATAEDLSGALWIAGNHDVIESNRGGTTLSPLRAAVEVAGPGSLFSTVDHRTEVLEKPSFVTFSGLRKRIEGKVLGVLALPYVARAVERDEKFAAELEEVFRQAAAFKGGPLAVVGHLTVPGALTGSETYDMPRGRDVDFPFSDVMKLRPTLVANGHYHRAQTVDRSGLVVVIPGSPHRFTFGERDDPRKGFTIVEVPA